MKTVLHVIALGILLTGCRMETSYGSCKGLVNKDEKNSKLQYEYSVRNIILAGIFSETIIWPIVTGAFWLECPVGPASTVK